MGKQYLNGVVYGGVTITGDEKLSFSVDYSTVLFSNYVTTWDASLTYTATQDCIAYVATKSDGSSSVLIYVNGNIAFDAGSATDRQTVTIFLKKGDVISKRVLSGSNSILVKYDIYPIIYKALHEYSTDEKVIGTWFGETLYEKSINTNFGSGEVRKLIDYTSSNVKHLIDVNGYIVSSDNCGIPIGSNNSLYFDGSDDNCKTGIYVKRGESSYWGTNPSIYVTIQYTKTS